MGHLATSFAARKIRNRGGIKAPCRSKIREPYVSA